MGIFRKIFSRATSMEQVALAAGRERWAEVSTLARGIDRTQLDIKQQEELDNYLLISGDALASLNIAEGEAWARQGDKGRAMEHLHLARTQAHSPTLKAAVDAALGLFSVDTRAHASKAQPLASCASGCCPPSEETASPTVTEMDVETRLDLILTGYPDVFAKRYHSLLPTLIEAVLLSHDGRLDEALELFARIEPENQCATFFFERGSLLARQQKTSLAMADLQETLRREPQHLLALEGLVDLYLMNGDSNAARQLIESTSGSNLSAAFGHARLARSYILQDDQQRALAHAQQAIDCGSRERENLELTAVLYEQNGDIDRAEQVLHLLGGGGCSGGQNLALAEFRFRQGRELSKALETYKSLARSEPANPAWLLRIGQIYLRQGWSKEGQSILKTLSVSDLVSDEIRQVAVRELER